MDYIRSIAKRYAKDNLSAYSAQLAFFLVLSIFPFLISMVAILGVLSLESNIFYSNEIYLIPSDVAVYLKDFMSGVDISTGGIIWSSILVTLWSSSKAVGALRRSLNYIFGFSEKRNFLIIKIFGMGYNLFLILAIIIFMFLPVLGTTVYNFIIKYIDISRTYFLLYNYLKWIVMFAFLFTLISIYYMFLPSVKLKLREIYRGALFTTVGWILNTLLYSYVITNFTRMNVLYGGISIFMVLSLWLYINSILIMLGSEINASFYREPKDA